VDWAKHVASGTLTKLTLPELKSAYLFLAGDAFDLTDGILCCVGYMKWKNVKGFSTMKKAELVEKITEMVEAEEIKQE